MLRVFFLYCAYSVLLKRVMSDSVCTALVCTCDDECRRPRIQVRTRQQSIQVVNLRVFRYHRNYCCNFKFISVLTFLTVSISRLAKEKVGQLGLVEANRWFSFDDIEVDDRT